MSEKLSPHVYAMLMAQQGLLTAMIAARFDPDLFAANVAAVRGTMKLAAVSDPDFSDEDRKAASKTVDEILDLYLRIVRTGDPNTP